MTAHRSTRGTVLIAGAANLFVVAIKLVAGIVTGSSAMLAEAAHSAADTLNQPFLLTSIHRGNRPADAGHPFGHGQERYFWSRLAAFGIFIAATATAHRISAWGPDNQAVIERHHAWRPVPG